MVSIRARLLLPLIIGLMLVIGAGGTWTYLRLQDGVNRIMDRELADRAWVLASWTQAEPRGSSEAKSESIARELDEMLENMHVGPRRAKVEAERSGELVYSVWREGVVPLTTSLGAPGWLTQASTEGISQIHHDQQLWHVFTVRTGAPLTVVNVAEPDRVRRDLLRDMLLLPLLGWMLSIPLAAALIWAAVHSGLRPLASVAQAIRKRAPGDLSQVQVAAPEEIAPLTAALNDLLGRLEALLEEERLFNAAAAHELRTPLAGIQLLAETALETTTEPATLEMLHSIVRSVGHAERVLKQLLTLAQVNSNAARAVALKPVDLKLILDEVWIDMAPLAVRRRMTLQPLPSVRAWVYADALSLRILLRNLVENALLHVPSPGTVAIAVRHENGGWQIQVTDTGPGLPAHLRDSIGAPFQRGERQDQAGSGLGLAIATRIAALHGTQLTFSPPEQKQGQGVSFDLRAAAPV